MSKFSALCLNVNQFYLTHWLDLTHSGATTSSHSVPGSDDNKGVLRIPQSSCITGVLQADCLISYPGHSLGVRSYASASEYWAKIV